MIIVTSENIFINRNKNEIDNVINNIVLEHDKISADNCFEKVDVEYNIQFFDKI